MKRILQKTLSMLLSCALLLGLLPAYSWAAGTEGLALAYTQNSQGDVSLEITGIGSGKTIYGVQLELTLAGSYQADEVMLTPQDSLAYSPAQGYNASYQDGQTTLTLYVASSHALNNGESLPLGRLTAGGMGIIPESARLSLLDSAGVPGELASVPVRQSADVSDLPFGDSFPISAPKAAHGSVQVLAAARENQTVTVTLTPDAGYAAGPLSVVDGAGKAVPLLKSDNTHYSFRMPGSAVEIRAVFTPDAAGLPFTDVPDTKWIRDAVEYVYQRGMMTGTSSTLFEPETTTTRGMILSILYRLEGSPDVGTAAFPDVPQGQWYSKPVAWAAEKKIVHGYDNGNFGPNDTITREQFVSILYRYASYKGCDLSATASLSGFQDLSSLASYASIPMHWAVGNGLVSGTGNNCLSPKGSATRCQAASILMRFCKKFGL